MRGKARVSPANSLSSNGISVVGFASGIGAEKMSASLAWKPPENGSGVGVKPALVTPLLNGDSSIGAGSGAAKACGSSYIGVSSQGEGAGSGSGGGGGGAAAAADAEEWAWEISSSTFWIRLCDSNGLVTTASQPALSARSGSNGSNVPVRRMTGMLRNSGWDFTYSQTS